MRGGGRVRHEGLTRSAAVTTGVNQVREESKVNAQLIQGHGERWRDREMAEVQRCRVP